MIPPAFSLMCMTQTRRHDALLALVLLTVSSAARAEPSPAAGNFAGAVEVDGRKVHLECKGTGSPTVILISGYRNDAEIWTTPPAPGVTPGAASERMAQAAAAAPLNDIPLLVPSRNKPVALPPNVPAGFSQKAFETAWRKGQDQLASLLPEARHVIATQSDHYIQIEQPDLVIDAVRQVVEAVRDPASWREGAQ